MRDVWRTGGRIRIPMVWCTELRETLLFESNKLIHQMETNTSQAIKILAVTNAVLSGVR